MSRTSITTPCPAQTTLNPSHRRISSFELFGEDTANIDYTRAVDQPLAGIKPRRRSMMGGPASRAAKKAPVTIFEDVAEDEELAVEPKTTLRGKNLLSKPPAKMAQRQQQAGNVGNGELGIAGGPKGRAGLDIAAGRRETLGPFRNMRLMDESAVEARATTENTGTGLPGGTGNSMSRREIGGATIKKNPRRQTIFMPEDTTVMTIHPGAHNTSRLDDTFQLPQRPSRVGTRIAYRCGDDVQQKPTRRPRESLALPPKRLPLRESFSSDNMPGWDLPGANTGKENLPPDAANYLNKQMQSLRLSDVPVGQDPRVPRSSLLAQTAASRHRQSIVPRVHMEFKSGAARSASPRAVQHTRLPAQSRGTSSPESKPMSRGPQVSQTAPRTKLLTGRVCQQGKNVIGQPKPDPRSQPVTVTEEKKQIRSFIASKRNDAQVAKLKQYPVLAGDLSQPDLYEDGWLAYQEVALTEVVNEIFKTNAMHSPASSSSAPLRDQLIEIYNQPEISLMHARVQASLEYGALAQPKTSIKDHSPSHDIGLRKRLMGLFLDSYDTNALTAAAQVVSGRQIPTPTSPSMDIPSLDPHVEKRALTAFLETFFICVADVDVESAQASDEEICAARWRKTMTRGLMLIWLLDGAKTSGAMAADICLFKRTSSKKSSAAVLDAFTTLLVPAIGDSARALRHLEYQVCHVQDLLDELIYRIDNIATDLRDGILLTHLVEVLIHNTPKLAELEFVADEDVSVRLPDGTLLISEILAHDLEEQRRQVLSQHLKMPCTSDSQRTYNVQIALSALARNGVDGNNMVATVSAADIVNGHREKTLSLIWSIVSVYGLRDLLDWRHLTADTSCQSGSTHTVPQFGYEEYALKDWAAAYAAKSCIPMRNLTTSFADGKIYEAILNSFSAYLPGDKVSGIGAQLAALGCSKAFSDKLKSSIGLIPSYQTTISNLAFLASRLIPLSRKHNAVATIQRAFRKRHERVVMSQRIKLRRMAHDCAKVVRTRNKVVDAAIVLQRAWRGVVNRRIRKLNDDVEAFQAVAKGWAARKKVTKTVFSAGW